MIRLLRVELTRVRWRRAIRLLVIGVFVLVGLVAAAAWWDSRPISASDLAEAQAQVDRIRTDPQVQKDIARCEKDPEGFLGDGNGSDPQTCEEVLVGSAENYVGRIPWTVSDRALETTFIVGYIVLALLIVGGATYAGADWNSGSMSNQLLFDTRRGRVWLAKAVAVLLTSAVVATLALGAFWVFIWWVMGTRGVDTPEALWRTIGWDAGRTVLLAASAAVGGYAITMLFRNTVATLGLLFAVSVVGSILVALIPVAGIGRWDLATNLTGIMVDGKQYYDYSLCPDLSGGPKCDPEQVLTLAEGVRFLGPLGLLAVGLSWWSFRRREIP
ncbi:MAG: hypothetical protein ACRCYU_16225 [Nocardioides sp.]